MNAAWCTVGGGVTLSPFGDLSGSQAVASADTIGCDDKMFVSGPIAVRRAKRCYSFYLASCFVNRVSAISICSRVSQTLAVLGSRRSVDAFAGQDELDHVDCRHEPDQRAESAVACKGWFSS